MPITPIFKPRKGADLLLEALHRLRSQVAGTPLEQLELVVFGQSRPAQPPDLGFPIHYSGHLHDDLSLRLLYAAADVFVIPSCRLNFPNTGLEAPDPAPPWWPLPPAVLTISTRASSPSHWLSCLIRFCWHPGSAGCSRFPSRWRKLVDAVRQRAEGVGEPVMVAGSLWRSAG